MVTVIPATFIKVTSYKHDDAAETSLVCGISLNSGVAVGEAWKVTRANIATRIFQETALGKEDSISGIVFADGTARLYVSSADVGASGTTSSVRSVDIPGAFSPSVAGSGTIDTGIRNVLRVFFGGLRDIAVKALASF